MRARGQLVEVNVRDRDVMLNVDDRVRRPPPPLEALPVVTVAATLDRLYPVTFGAEGTLTRQVGAEHHMHYGSAGTGFSTAS